MVNEVSQDVIKHLEFIQAVITRLNNASFLIKGWAMTVAAGIIGLAASQKDMRICGAGLVPLACFWLLDSYFLRQERMYRHLYDDVRRKEVEADRFSMDTKIYRESVPLMRSIISPLHLVFYPTPLATLLALAVIGLVSS